MLGGSNRASAMGKSEDSRAVGKKGGRYFDASRDSTSNNNVSDFSSDRNNDQSDDEDGSGDSELAQSAEFHKTGSGGSGTDQQGHDREEDLDIDDKDYSSDDFEDIENMKEGKYVSLLSLLQRACLSGHRIYSIYRIRALHY